MSKPTRHVAKAKRAPTHELVWLQPKLLRAYVAFAWHMRISKPILATVRVPASGVLA